MKQNTASATHSMFAVPAAFGLGCSAGGHGAYAAAGIGDVVTSMWHLAARIRDAFAPTIGDPPGKTLGV